MDAFEQDADVAESTQHWSAWPTRDERAHSRVESVEVRAGVTLVLSEIVTGELSMYRHDEGEDIVGVGYHLSGGTQFRLDNVDHVTAPLEIWAGANAKGSSSTFTLPSTGFRSAALRFRPEAALELLNDLALGHNWLAQLAATAPERTTLGRLAIMLPRSAAVVEELLSSQFTGTTRQLHLESGALALIVGLAATSARVGHGQPFVVSRQLHEAREHLDANLSDPPTTVQLARIVGINDFALKRGFKEQFGTTVFGYVRQRRMEQALAHLDAGMSVASAALLVGYECPRCFADAFRRHFGLLPSETGPRARFPAHNR